jgi:hypothetical protein
MAYKTIFKPKNIKKYIGDATNIVCRSLWERRVCKFLDENINITKWSSEEIVIPYLNPLDKKMHNYFPDFLVQFNSGNNLQTWLIEVKPAKQTFLKENASKKEKIIWVINNAKWNAAKTFCQKNNMQFKLLTEKEIFSNANTN